MISPQAQPGVETQQVELTEEQLSSLSSGDMVEMDGDLYLVDVQPDPSGGDKQLLSFIPIDRTTDNSS